MGDYLDYSRILEATEPSGIVDGLFSGHGNGRFLGSWSIGTSPVGEVGGGDPGPAEGGTGVAGHLPHRRGRRALLRRRRAKLNSPEDAAAHRARDAEAAFAAARAGPPAALLDSQAVGDDMADYLDYSRILEATEPSGIVDGLFSGHGNGRFLGSWSIGTSPPSSGSGASPACAASTPLFQQTDGGKQSSSNSAAFGD